MTSRIISTIPITEVITPPFAAPFMRFEPLERNAKPMPKPAVNNGMSIVQKDTIVSMPNISEAVENALASCFILL